MNPIPTSVVAELASKLLSMIDEKSRLTVPIAAEHEPTIIPQEVAVDLEPIPDEKGRYKVPPHSAAGLATFCATIAQILVENGVAVDLPSVLDDEITKNRSNRWY